MTDTPAPERIPFVDHLVLDEGFEPARLGATMSAMTDRGLGKDHEQDAVDLGVGAAGIHVLENSGSAVA